MKTDHELLGSGVCRWCKLKYRLSGRRHKESCPSYSETPYSHEIWPGIWLGSVDARAEPQWYLVVGILSQANVRYVNSQVAQPECPYFLIDHEDGEAGLLAKLGRAWDMADGYCQNEENRILFHCHQGASRSACALAGWMVRRGHPLDEVLERIFSTRPATAHFWSGWLPELRALEARKG